MTDRLCKISLFSAVLAGIIGEPFASLGDSRVDGTYAGAYNQVLAVRQQQDYVAAQSVPVVQPASTVGDLPVDVEDKKLADDIKNNKSDSTTMNDLERCSMIDIRGVFKWGVPQSGQQQLSKPQCVAVVNLIDVNTNKVLATTTVAAGDMMKCNIDMFPESGYSNEISNVILPADEAPTEKDVEKVLNKEQKQNAGFKIAAAAIIGGIAGNMLAPKEPGNDKLMGTSKTQLLDTAIGAVTAGGVMAASSYAGKVAGDTIKSTAVNATAGMLVGNMGAGVAGSDSVLAITKCTVEIEGTEIEKDCIIGRHSEKGTPLQSDDTNHYFVNQTGTRFYRCSTDNKSCTTIGRHIDVQLEAFSKKTLNDMETADFNTIEKNNVYYLYNNTQMQTDKIEDAPAYYRVSSMTPISHTKPAYAVFDSLPSKVFGYKVSDYDDKLAQIPHKFYYRYNDKKEVGDELKAGGSFVPSERNAQDGDIIDLNNEARAKATLTGAAAGGALGGFAGYQGAQSEIAERWTTAVDEYRNSLLNFTCFTGERFLSFYNDMAQIPAMRNSTAEQNQVQNQQ